MQNQLIFKNQQAQQNSTIFAHAQCGGQAWTYVRMHVRTYMISIDINNVGARSRLPQLNFHTQFGMGFMCSAVLSVAQSNDKNLNNVFVCSHSSYSNF